MCIGARAVVSATVFLTALLVPYSVTYGQAPTPAPSSAAGEATPAKPAPKPEPDFWTQEQLTGEWAGTRTQWTEKGVESECRHSRNGW
jgi:hypothetical protein